MNTGITQPKHRPQRGFIALISTVIISTILIGLALSIGGSGVFARFDVLNSEYKRISLGLAESCSNIALLRVAQDYNYAPAAGGDLVTIGTDAQGRTETCLIESVNFPNGKAGVQNTAVVTTSAEYPIENGANSTVTISATIQNPAYAVPPKGSLTVVLNVVNDDGGTKQASDFNVTVTATNAYPNSFSGAAGSGTLVMMDAGAFTLAPNAVSGYTESDIGCSGTMTAGATQTCTISEDDIPTTATLTMIAQVKNDNGGTKVPTDFPLFLDGVSTVSGVPVTGLSAGTHTVTASAAPSGYTASSWGYDCTAGGSINLAIGNKKTCIITFDDIAPPSPICADTVMMLDRTSSMFGDNILYNNHPEWIADEKTAAKSLITLYTGVTPHPQIGIGHFADKAYSTANQNNTSAEIYTLLTNNYASLASNVDSALVNIGNPLSTYSWTNLNAAISVGDSELNSARHDSSKQKVLILVSDGDANIPTGTTNHSVTLNPSGAGTFSSWTPNTGTSVNAVASNDSNTSYVSKAVQGETFAFPNVSPSIPVGATNISVTLHAVVEEAGGTSGTIEFLAENGANQLYDTRGPLALTNAYTDIPWTVPTTETGAAWTPANLNTLATKFGFLNTSSSGAVPHVTQLYLVISYSSGGNTAFKTPTAAHTPNNWDVSTVTSVQTANNVYASDNGNAQQGYSFGSSGLSVPTGATVTGVEVDTEAHSSDSTGCAIGAELSSNGSAFTNTGTNAGLTGSDSIEVLGGATSLWSRTWVPSDFNSANFTVRVAGVDPGSSCSNNSTTSLDLLQVKVYYTLPGSSVTLAPSGTGTFAAWTPNTGTAVNAVATSNGDTSYVSAPVQTESYAFPGVTPSIPSGATGISVTLHAVAEEATGSTGTIQFIAENGASQLYDTRGALALTSGYQDIPWTVPTTETGATWTPANLNTLTTKFGFVNTSTNGAVPRVTQLYLVVTYTLVADPTELALDAADTAKQDGTQIFTIYFGNGQPDVLAELASGSTANGSHEDGSSNDKSDNATTGNTGLKPAALVATPSQWGTANKAFASDNAYATATTSGKQQGYGNFFGASAVQSGADISGIQVNIEAKTTSTNNCKIGVELSADGGSTFTTSGTSITLNSTSDKTYTAGGSTSLWGRATWFSGDVADGKLVVRLQDNCSTGTTLSVDQVLAETYYNYVPENIDDDNFFVSPTSADMTNIFQTIGAKVCPAAVAPPAAPPPTTGTLIVLTHVVNDNGGTNAASDFTMSVTGLNPSQTSFAGSESPGVSVTLDPGAYSANQNATTFLYTKTLGASCSGTINAGDVLTCSITDDDIPPPPPAAPTAPPPPANVNIGSWQEVP